MTTQQLYNQLLKKQISQEKFLYEVRRDERLTNKITKFNSFNDTISILKRNSIISEETYKVDKSTVEIKNDFATIDIVSPYEYEKGIDFELDLVDKSVGQNMPTNIELDVASKKVLKNLASDGQYYTKKMQSPEEKKQEKDNLRPEELKKDMMAKNQMTKAKVLKENVELSNWLDLYKNNSDKFKNEFNKLGIDNTIPPTLAWNRISDKDRNSIYNKILNNKVDTVITNKLSENLGDGYTHFAIMKSNNKIADGWDYSELYDEYEKAYDNQSIREYTKGDLIDNFPDNKPGDFKIITRKSLERSGVNPSDTNNWYKSSDINEDLNPDEMNKQQLKLLGQIIDEWGLTEQDMEDSEVIDELTTEFQRRSGMDEALAIKDPAGNIQYAKDDSEASDMVNNARTKGVILTKTNV